uniref:Variant surface glycoprotein n=1 Tax=Trypanosoma brucei TaxID=5691 RepID=Q583A5_9TRYP|nr:hypothetical protein, unlikely [Trypanosoma brucei]
MFLFVLFCFSEGTRQREVESMKWKDCTVATFAGATARVKLIFAFRALSPYL